MSDETVFVDGYVLGQLLRFQSEESYLLILLALSQSEYTFSEQSCLFIDGMIEGTRDESQDRTV